ncbi:hypothetical protein MMC08_003843 [Hypocenomyce scalaris]|nr:hypothetical protein [Hypocenomyce scalaris]
MVNTLIKNMDEDPFAIIDFRRNFTLGGQPALQSFSDMEVAPKYVFGFNEGHAGAIFGIVVDGPTNALVETIMANVISSQNSVRLTAEVRVSAIYESAEMTCFPSASAKVLWPLANLTQTDAPDDIASAAITALGVFA